MSANENEITAILDFRLPVHEGNRLVVYDDKDSKSLFIGKTLLGNPTIGTGRNLIGRGITDDERRYLLSNDISSVYADLDHLLPWWRSLDSVRASVLCDMCFNMGIQKLLGFKLFLAAMRSGNWMMAIIEMKDSAWYNQVGPRSIQLYNDVKTGQSPV